ncbi:GcrA family cell cycle regulator [Pseudochrobactrum sp. sp1633]|uniref:GcrA family cell cycle regulator n=1 Tax=Pseudochrobactrum sp. sp1633 TaxID=3036706 RepID=UPI0025A665E1|nr:GcrA family cell cycle regulator [Pseudochrobactrum sp. sp1633]MDM8346254.1 GcrA family cell cycle regulator [Pseudochrobactrum sp. sp1633]
MSEPHKSWSDEDKAQVAKMMVEGLSFSKIAGVFNVTKNAVIGLVKRNPELEAVNSKRQASKPAAKTADEIKDYRAAKAREYREAKRKAKTENAIIVKVEPKQKSQKPIPFPTRRNEDFQTVGRPLVELSSFDCRWAVNDAGKGEEHLFCGSRVNIGSRYCAYHKAKAFGHGTPSERAAINILKKHAA